MGKLPTRYRRASNIFAGYEIKDADGNWHEVRSQMHITSPATFVRFDFTDGTAAVHNPRDEIMSRRSE
jgi:hypothetical protein